MLRKKEDQPSIRWRQEAHGVSFDQDGYDRMLNRYYEIHGWDPESSVPRRDTLERLGLGYIAKDLVKHGIDYFLRRAQNEGYQRIH
jgi:aldehyde:ferredoxin oxidoreductase